MGQMRAGVSRSAEPRKAPAWLAQVRRPGPRGDLQGERAGGHDVARADGAHRFVPENQVGLDAAQRDEGEAGAGGA